MNLAEKRRCLFCQKPVRHNEELFVLANVLVAHPSCLPGGRQ
jgi:hypothetical protein